MLTVIIIVLLAGGLATLTYGWLERAPSGQQARLWRPALFRAVAWAALGLLVADLSCGVRGTPGRPLVLLDASLSMTAAGGQWQRALDTARALGEVQTFGDERPPAIRCPTGDGRGWHRRFAPLPHPDAR